MKIKTVAQIAVDEREAQLASDLIAARSLLSDYKRSQKVCDAKIREILRNPLHTDEYNIREALVLLEGSK